MNSKELRNLQEAYMEVYTSPEQTGEFELWVDSLLEEGYDLSDYTWDEMYEFYLDEAIASEKGKAKMKEMLAARTTSSGRAKKGKGSNVAAIKHIGRSEREGLGGTPMTPTMARNPAKSRNSSGTGNKAKRRGNQLNNSFDLYDIILSHLLDEGYAETPEAAEVIMVNMSEEWRESIVEAQEARNNPEDYEERQRKEKSKKQKAMQDPHTGINSPAFAAFMKKQGR